MILKLHFLLGWILFRIAPIQASIQNGQRGRLQRLLRSFRLTLIRILIVWLWQFLVQHAQFWRQFDRVQEILLATILEVAELAWVILEVAKLVFEVTLRVN